MFNELKELLKDFNPTLTLRDNKYNLVSDIAVLSQVDYKGSQILFGYVESLTGEHGWIKVLDNEVNMKTVMNTIESQVAMRTQA